MDSRSRGCRCGIVPPYLLLALAEADLGEPSARARRTLEHDGLLRNARRSISNGWATMAVAPESAAAGATPGLDRTVDDAHHSTDLPGDVVRREGDPEVSDAAVNQAYDGLGDTWHLYKEAFGRTSIDGKGLPLVASVHYGRDYDNAFWDGAQMVFGDGDGEVFVGFTGSIDVIGHELTHGVTQHTADLVYSGQSGALNESISDVFGSLVRQRTLGQTADQADWLIGADVLAPGVKSGSGERAALRSMKAPGTAYDDPRLGKDPQPAHMDGYVETTDDNGGVHLNSGIPNHAFYLAATAIGGNAWEAPGQVWYDVLTGDRIGPHCDFATFAGLTVDAAVARFGDGSREAGAVRDAWQQVGVLSGGQASPSPAVDPAETSGSGRHRGPAPDDELHVRRTGGFGGLVKERVLHLHELPDDDADRWRELLGNGRLPDLASDPPYPDAFCYGVTCRAAGLDVTIPEPALEPETRELFERTLGT